MHSLVNVQAFALVEEAEAVGELVDLGHVLQLALLDHFQDA